VVGVAVLWGDQMIPAHGVPCGLGWVLLGRLAGPGWLVL